MIQLDRNYGSTGILSAGSGLYIKDVDLKAFKILIPVSSMPSESAPESIENPILSVAVNGQVEGKSTMEQKTYAFNWNRDNRRTLEQYAGKEVELLERDGMEFTGRRFKGTIAFGKQDFADNGIMNGNLWVTVTEDLGYVDDIRDMIVQTAVVTSPLTEITLTGTDSAKMVIEGSPNATFSFKVESTGVVTTNFAEGILTITAQEQSTVANTIVEVTASATGEASSKRTFMVKVLPATA